MARRRRPQPEDEPASVNTQALDPHVVPSDPFAVNLTEKDRDLLVNTFCDEIEGQLNARAEMEERWERYTRVYSGEPDVQKKSYPWDGASNLVVNLGKIYVDQEMARIMQGIFQNEPHWVAEQINRKDSAGVKPIERYMDFARQHLWKQKKVVKPFVLECCKLGLGVMTNGWRDEPNFQWDADAGKPVERGRFIGPAPVWVPREDFLHPQGFNDLQTMPWLAYRPWFTRQELRMNESRHFFEDVEQLFGNEDEETNLRRIRAGYDQVGEVARADEFALYAPWQVWFNWDLDGDGEPEPYTMMLHAKSKHLLRIVRNPYTRGMRPFIAAPFVEIEGQLDGCGIPQAIEYYQAEATTIHNQKIDNGTLANAPVFVAMRGAGFTDRLKFRPGTIFLSSTDVNGIKQLVVQSGYQRQIADEQAVVQFAERAVGLSDPNLGQVSSPVGRAAASTMMAVMQEGTRRHDYNTAELRDALSEQGLQLLELWQTHGLPEPGDPFSPEQVLDEGDAVALRSLLHPSTQLRGVLTLKLNVATAALNKEIQKQSDLQLLQVVQQYFLGIKTELMQTLPMLAQAPPQVSQMVVRMAQGVDRMMTRVFQDNGAFDLEELLVGDLLAEMVQAMQQAAPAPGGMNGTGLPGNVATASPFGGGAAPGPGGGNPLASLGASLLPNGA